MDKTDLSPEVRKELTQSQKNEITEYHIYNKLADVTRDRENSELLRKIASEELAHYNFWKKYTGEEVKPNRFKIFRYYWIARILGLTFGIKLMERGEEGAQDAYTQLAETIPGAREIVEDEHRHEDQLINMIKEERLDYAGSVVLGLNDALVELTGTLAGLTFALQKTNLIALIGLITGIAASMSMAASEYLSTRTEEKEATEEGPSPLKSSIYTGLAYIGTVVILILPYMFFSHYMAALGVTIFNAILIIFVFNYYISVARDLNFKHRFLEMALISLGVAALSFGIGVLIRTFLGVDV
jgi:VIT1/CCC1 family predicted Fe2+/Mn2+ transporter